MEDGLDEVSNGMVNWGFATLNDDGSITGSATETTWTLQGGDAPTLADYWNEMIVSYDYDYKTLSDTEAADSDCLHSWMTAIRLRLRQAIL